MSFHRTNTSILSALLLSALVLVGCASSDPIAQEYSSLNGETVSSGEQYLDVDLAEDHVFVETTEDEVIELLKNGTGAIYFGFPQCPWCRNAMPVMDEAAKTVALDQIHYLNVYDIRDTKSVDATGSIVVDEPGTEEYSTILELLGDFAPEYEGLEDPAHRRIHVPLVVVVVNGEVVGSHLSTVESQTDPFTALTSEQHDELLKIYQDLFSELPGCGIDSC